MNQSTSEATLPVEISREETEYGLATDLMQLTKARLSMLVVITTFVGYCMGSVGPLDWLRLMNTVLGTAMAAAGAAVLNQVIETKVDRLMERTRLRPLPAGRMTRRVAFFIGVGLSLGGCLYLWAAVNLSSSLLATATVAIYLFLYTPFKRRTSFCVTVGAISGAIPPVIGWTASRPGWEIGAWVLFGILFAWQMPHFLAIAWMYRDEYAQAGFVMLKRDDFSGASTARESLLYTVVLAAISLIPYFNGLNSLIYFIGAVILNGVMLFFAVQFLVERERASARRLFLTSIFYLPFLLGLMIVTKC